MHNQQLLAVQRSYSELRSENSYKRRITTIITLPDLDCFNKQITDNVLVEYMGKKTTNAPYGNAKNTTAPYVCTHPDAKLKIEKNFVITSSQGKYITTS